MGSRAGVLVGFAGFGLFWGSWGAVLPLIQRHAQVSDGALGFALMGIGLGALLSLRPAGSIADRHPRATMPVTFALLGLSAAGPVVATGWAALAAACVLIGFCSGAADAAINAAGARCEAAGTPVLTLAHGAFSALVVAASLSMAAFLRHARTPWPLLVTAACLLAAAALTAVLPMAPAADGDAPAQAGRLRVSRMLLLLGALGAVAYLVENAWQSWAAIQLHDTLRATPAVAATGPAVFAGCATAGRFVGHLLQRRLTPGRMLAAGAVVAAAGSALAALAPSPAVAFAGIALAGLGTSVCAPTLIAAAGRAVPDAPGGATSTVITLSYLGFVLGPAAVGLLAEGTTLRLALVAVAAAAATLALAGRTLPRTDTTHRAGETAVSGGLR